MYELFPRLSLLWQWVGQTAHSRRLLWLVGQGQTSGVTMFSFGLWCSALSPTQTSHCRKRWHPWRGIKTGPEPQHLRQIRYQQCHQHHLHHQRPQPQNLQQRTAELLLKQTVPGRVAFQGFNQDFSLLIVNAPTQIGKPPRKNSNTSLRLQTLECASAVSHHARKQPNVTLISSGVCAKATWTAGFIDAIKGCLT